MFHAVIIICLCSSHQQYVSELISFYRTVKQCLLPITCTQPAGLASRKVLQNHHSHPLLDPVWLQPCLQMLLKQSVSQLVRWCFQPSQPQMITSGLKETLLKRYIVERTSKTEIRPEEQKVRKRRVVGRIYGMKYS